MDDKGIFLLAGTFQRAVITTAGTTQEKLSLYGKVIIAQIEMSLVCLSHLKVFVTPRPELKKFLSPVDRRRAKCFSRMTICDRKRKLKKSHQLPEMACAQKNGVHEFVHRFLNCSSIVPPFQFLTRLHSTFHKIF